jgi:hypothetical protein
VSVWNWIESDTPVEGVKLDFKRNQIVLLWNTVWLFGEKGWVERTIGEY